ncbi:synaptonemal complex protein 1 [Artemisia annua]|uniref:Synaptonemal complex protein 1 n=1 Tax=Artemisia annua TaxID=35608 RepID=A0A2U1NCI8_ARTAN|nr:synaptonemal complex protein 1 [Artemisia annua]
MVCKCGNVDSDVMVNRIHQEKDKKESNLKSTHCEDLKKMQLRAEDELKELLQNECEAELRELRYQHEEECRHFEEELTLQKEKVAGLFSLDDSPTKQNSDIKLEMSDLFLGVD